MFYQLDNFLGFFLLTVFLLGFFILARQKFSWALGTVIFLLPAYLLKFQVAFVSLTVLDCLLIIIFFSYLFLKPKRKIVLPRPMIVLLLSTLLIFGAVGSFLAGDQQRALGLFKSVFLLPLLATFTAVNFLQESKLYVKKFFLKPLFFSALFVGLVAFVYKILGHVSFDDRLSGFWNSPNQLAMYLAVGIVAGFILFLKEKNTQVFWGLLFLTLILFFTKSLGAIISLLLAGFVYLLFRYGKNKKLWACLTISFYVCLVGSVFLAPGSSKLASGSLLSRLVVWQSAQKIIAAKPVFGIGLGNFQEWYLDFQKYFPPYPEWAVPHAHNLWFDVWLSFGMFGAVAFLVLVFFWWKELFVNRFKKHQNVSFLVLFFVFFMIYGLVDEPVLRNDLSVAFWLTFWLTFG